jgi:uncharacterized protein
MSIEQLATHIAERSSDVGPRAVACTVVSELTPERDKARAIEVSGRIGIEHRILEISALAVPEVRRNLEDRCYHCKCLVFQTMREALGNEYLLLDGTNADDAPDRPGLKAVREFKVLSPLADLSLGKSHIRALAFDAGLPNWGTPSESCLATRIPVGVELSLDQLNRVEALESYLHTLGMDTVRVRPDNLMATVEYLPQYYKIVAENRDKIVALAKKIGQESCTFKEWVE